MRVPVSNLGRKSGLIADFAADESGGTAIEYGLILTFIALAIITAATQVGTKTAGVFTKISGLWPF